MIPGTSRPHDARRQDLAPHLRSRPRRARRTRSSRAEAHVACENPSRLPRSCHKTTTDAKISTTESNPNASNASDRAAMPRPSVTNTSHTFHTTVAHSHRDFGWVRSAAFCAPDADGLRRSRPSSGIWHLASGIWHLASVIPRRPSPTRAGSRQSRSSRGGARATQRCRRDRRDGCARATARGAHR